MSACAEMYQMSVTVGGDALKKGQRRRLMVVDLWITWVDSWWPSTIILRDINIKLWPVATLHKQSFQGFSPLLIISRPNWFQRSLICFGNEVQKCS